MDSWTVRLVLGAIVVGWLGSLFASMVSDYEPPAALNALFLSLAGAVLAMSTHKEKSNDE